MTLAEKITAERVVPVPTVSEQWRARTPTRTRPDSVAAGVGEARDGATGRSWLRIRPWVLVALVLVVLAVGAWSYRWMVDDGFINLRVVRQIEAGNGPVFNAGERVEVSTSPAWIGFLTLADLLLPVRLEWIAVLGGIALTLGGVTLAIAGAATLTGERRPGELLVPVGALILAVLPEIWLNASAGLENGLLFLWLGACLLCLARWSRGHSQIGIAGAALLGFGPLIRPELTLATLVFLLVVLGSEFRTSRSGEKVRFLVAALALPVAYEVFRMGYYASVTPNSAIAKEASRSYWSAGWTYLVQTIDPYWLWIPLIVVAVGAYLPLIRVLLRAGHRRAVAVAIAFVVSGLMNGLFVVWVGGDFIHARLLIPALFAVLAPVAVVPLRRVYLGVAIIVPWALITLVGLRSPRDAPHPYLASRNSVTLAQYKYALGGSHVPWFKGHGIYFNRKRLPAEPAPGRDPAVAEYGTGAVGYALGPNVYVLDLLGLGDALTSHLEITHRGLVAHEKPLPGPWVAARLAAPGSRLKAINFQTTLLDITPIGDPGTEPFPARVADARTALKCGAIRNLQKAVSDPLDPGRFLSNLANAFSFWELRIPPEPRNAVTRFCPVGTPIGNVPASH